LDKQKAWQKSRFAGLPSSPTSVIPPAAWQRLAGSRALKQRAQKFSRTHRVPLCPAAIATNARSHAMRIGSGPNSPFAAEAGGETTRRAISESGERSGKITNGFTVKFGRAERRTLGIDA
jgi:hypothetical protein